MDHPGVGQAVERLIDQLGAAGEPALEGQVETALRAVEEAGRDAGLHQAAHDQLAAVAGDVAQELGVDRERELDQAVIQERRPHLERVGHARAVDLGEEIAGQEGVDVGPLHALDRLELFAPVAAEVPEVVVALELERGT